MTRFLLARAIPEPKSEAQIEREATALWHKLRRAYIDPRASQRSFPTVGHHQEAEPLRQTEERA